jgi:hypothetical protein
MASTGTTAMTKECHTSEILQKSMTPGFWKGINH